LKVLNIHKRTINQPKDKVTELLKTLSTENDRIWPKEKWPEMKFKEGIQIGAKGGHGPIRYSTEKYNPNEIIQFRFSKPNGFNGIHKFEIKELDKEKTDLTNLKTISQITENQLNGIYGLSFLENRYRKKEENKV
jgi:hypothetical protein